MRRLSKQRAFLLLRYTLIAATGYLVLAEGGFAQVPVGAMLVVLLALASNVLAAQLPESTVGAPRFAAAVLLFDTAWVTAALLLSGQFSAEFFYLYFFVLLLAAIGESLWLIAVGACAVCAAYLFGYGAVNAGLDLASPSLMRLPFLFSTAVFFGYLVERTRREERRADDAEALAAQLRRTLHEFEVLYERAQQADGIKTEFLATISHELRTPLTTLVGYVELLMDECEGRGDIGEVETLQRVHVSSRMLQQAISRMLEASRVEFGKEQIDCDEFPLQLVMDELRDEFTASASVSLFWPEVREFPPLRTDYEKLHTILRNLVENAIKYTPVGSIEVTASWNAVADEIELRVVDTGIGIAPEEMRGIFEAFRRGSDSESSGKSGVGLGLYIVQRLTQRLGGDVRVESEPGRGARFTVRLPRLLYRGAAVAAGPVATAACGTAAVEP